MRENKNSSKLSCKARNKPHKCHTKNRPFVFYTISKDRICHILFSRVESPENIGFDSDGSSGILDNSDNEYI